jgi:hypothetical protein
MLMLLRAGQVGCKVAFSKLARGKEGSSSFLKKRTKKLLLLVQSRTYRVTA